MYFNFIFAGILIFLYYHQSKKLKYSEDGVNSAIIAGIENTKNIQNIKSIVKSVSDGLKDSIMVTKKEFLNKKYSDWTDFVDRSCAVSVQYQKVDIEFQHLVNKKKILDELLNESLYLTSGEDTEMFEKRLISTIPSIKNKYQILSNQSRDVVYHIDKALSMASDLYLDAKNASLKYEDLIKIAHEGWDLKTIFSVHGLGALCWFLPGKMIAGTIGTAIAPVITIPTAIVLGIASGTTYHLYEEFYKKPEQLQVYNYLLTRFNNAAKLISIYTDYSNIFQKQFDSALLRLDELKTDLERLDSNSFNNFVDHIKKINQKSVEEFKLIN